ncbi:MAG: S-layer homology domain-containing protein [Oscillospiraceae bacterium]|jgi:uncharacterized protein YkwD|nr:S-layer homology domain-containing protein [Oscillospiraceae bacterium]
MLKKISHRLLGAVLAAAVLLSAFVPAPRISAADLPALPFTDVRRDQWFYGDVAYCYANRIMAGVSGTEFAPGSPVTRGMLVTMLYQLQGKPAVSSDSSFPDITGSEWYAKPVAWAKQTRIVAGYDDGTFKPNKEISRQELVSVMYRYARDIDGQDVSAGSASQLGFADNAQIQAWAADAIKWSVANKIVTGMPGNLFAPNDGATRAQAAVILHKYLDPSAAPYIPVPIIAIGISEADAEKAIGTPYRTINDQGGTRLCFYGSYDAFYMVYFKNGAVSYYYTNDIDAAIANDSTVSKYTDQNDGNVVYAVDKGSAGTVAVLTTEQVIFELTNAFRGFNGVYALGWNDKLALAARNHSLDMATRNYFAHNTPEGKDPWQRITEAGYEGYGSGENIIAGYGNGQSSVNGWVNSSGHRSNMLSNTHTELGVGYVLGTAGSKYSNYGTQCFGAR